MCRDYGGSEAKDVEAVEVTLTNGTDDAIEIPTYPYDGRPAFALAGSEGELLWAPDMSCTIYTCDQVMEGTCDIGCPGCLVVEAVRIEPGKSVTLSWPGVVYVERALPAECVGSGQSCGEWSDTWDGQCVQAVPATGGSYTFSTRSARGHYRPRSSCGGRLTATSRRRPEPTPTA